MVYFATIDTNVIVSYFYQKDSPPGKIVEMALDGPIVPLFHQDIFREYADVLLREKFDFDIGDVLSFLWNFYNRGILLDRTDAYEKFVDEKDVVFYEVTLTGRSSNDAYLITGNKKHFPQKYFVVSPREMLSIIEASKS